MKEKKGWMSEMTLLNLVPRHQTKFYLPPITWKDILKGFMVEVLLPAFLSAMAVTSMMLSIKIMFN